MMRRLRQLGRRVLPEKAHHSDAVVIAAVVSILVLIELRFGLLDRFHAFTRAHDEWGLDELVVLMVVLTAGMLVYTRRRMAELAKAVRAHKAAEKREQTLARHDPLTGLPNRRCYIERLTEAVRVAAERDGRVAVMLIDLDGFKAVTDVHGYSVGEQTLVEFSERVSKILAADSVLARLGGNVFGIVLPRVGSLERPTRLAHRIVAETSRPFVVAGAATRLGVGIGIAVAPDNGSEVDELLRRADLALYRAKADGTSGIRFFEPEMDTHVERRTTIERELRGAIATDSIQVYFQPLVDIQPAHALVGEPVSTSPGHARPAHALVGEPVSTSPGHARAADRIIGFEALARWNSPVLGAVFPSVFITMAEETGLIHQLGDQLLRTACREAARWPHDMILAFNISPVQMREPTLGLRILSILAETGLSPSRLELEVTESAIVEDALMGQRTIDELRKAGVRVALDDFGTGYATMSQLLSFRFDKIKIDRSFVTRLGKDPESEVIVRAIIGLANGLGLSTTAEGVEEPEQLAVLRGNGCHFGQGYLFGKAMPAGEVQRLLGREPKSAVSA
jgi:diguanylate cyclase (GGDEF)-like protein